MKIRNHTSQAGRRRRLSFPQRRSQALARIAQSADPATTAAPSAEAELLEDEIVVTGTSIKGVAPIGSSIQTVGVADLEKTAATNLSTLVNTIPALSTNGSLAQGENLWSFYSPQIHQLGGSSSNTTLVVIDGMRSPGGGAQFNQIDPNIIPTSAIERVDVLADGASSVYGSDAVAGVVNFITRKTIQGHAGQHVVRQSRFSYDTWDLNGIWGTDWETGGVYAAASYSHGSQLFVKDRDWASRGDYRPYGGSNTNSFTCDPATIRVTGVSSGTVPAGNVIFLSPSATTPVANKAALNGACNLSAVQLVHSLAVPQPTRCFKVDNDFSDKLTLSGIDGLQPQPDSCRIPVPASSTTSPCSARVRARRGPAESVLHRAGRRADRQRGDHQLAGDARRRQIRLHRVAAGRHLRQRRPRLQIQRQLVADAGGFDRLEPLVARRLQAVLRRLRDARAQRHHAIGRQHDGIERSRPERRGAAASADHQQRARCLESRSARTAPIRW